MFGLVALFAYEVSEISINSFFINYVTEVGWMNARDASLVLSFGGLGLFMIGRFVGSWIMRRVRAEKMLFWCATGNGYHYAAGDFGFRLCVVRSPALRLCL